MAFMLRCGRCRQVSSSYKQMAGLVLSRRVDEYRCVGYFEIYGSLPLPVTAIGARRNPHAMRR